MKYLFDASSITEILSERRGVAADTLSGESTLDLAIYELGNMVWKESRHKRRAEEETATIIGYVEQVLGIMDIQRIQLSDIQEIERNAVKLALSFYDASYLTSAKALGRTLVTEDRLLRDAAEKTGVPCFGVEEMK